MSFGKMGARGGFGGLGSLGGAVAPAYTTGLTKANTSSVRALVQGNTRNVRVISIGDSTTRGQSTGIGTSQAVDAWPMQLAPLMAAQGFNAGANNIFCDGAGYGGAQTMASLVAADSRISFTGGWTLGATKSAGGNNFSATAAGSMSFVTTANCSEAILGWRDSASGRNFTWSVDGGATTAVNSTGTLQLGWTVIPLGSLGIHTITIAWSLGSIAPVSIVAYDATNAKKELSFWNWGICGGTSANLIDNSDAGVGRIAMIANSNSSPDLALVEGGIINDWRTSVSVATSQANLTTLVQACLAKGNVILCVPVFDNSATGLAANQQAYVDAMYAVAAANGCGVFDIRKRWGSYANAVTNGWQTNSDTVHPTPAGYADIAAQMVPVIKYAVS